MSLLVLHERFRELSPSAVARDANAAADAIRKALQTRWRNCGDALVDLVALFGGEASAWNDPVEGEESDSEGFSYGDITFLTLEQVLAEKSALEALQEIDEVVEPIGPVSVSASKRNWVPFAVDVAGGTFYCDLRPAKGGTAGQVIWVDSDLTLILQLADSIDEFVAYGIACLERQHLPQPEQPVPLLLPPAIMRRLAARNQQSSPKCREVDAIWAKIMQLAKERNKYLPEGGKVEFRRGCTEERLAKIEKRLKTAIPCEYRCLLLSAKVADKAWPSAIAMLYPESLLEAKSWIHEQLLDGTMAASSELRASIKSLPFHYLGLVQDGSRAEVFVSSDPSGKDEGVVWFRRESYTREGGRSSYHTTLERRYPSVVAFLRAGLDELTDDLARLKVQEGSRPE